MMAWLRVAEKGVWSADLHRCTGSHGGRQSVNGSNGTATALAAAAGSPADGKSTSSLALREFIFREKHPPKACYELVGPKKQSTRVQFAGGCEGLGAWVVCDYD
jgi:hypothetical protein